MSLLTWTCATDNNGSEHSYPRSGDGNYETAIEILNNGSSHDVSTATATTLQQVFSVLTALKGTISNSAVTTIGTGYATATNVALVVVLVAVQSSASLQLVEELVTLLIIKLLMRAQDTLRMMFWLGTWW